MSPDIQLVVLFMSFTLALILAMNRQNGRQRDGDHGHHDEVLRAAQEAAAYWRRLALEQQAPEDRRKNLLERLRYMQLLRAKIMMQIAQQGGRSYAQPPLLLQLDNADDEIKEIEMVLDGE